MSRVISFLDDLGGEAVHVRQSQSGERVVIFETAFVKRVATARSESNGTGNTVVTDSEAGGR